MTRRSYLSCLTGAMALAALMVNAPAAIAQSAEEQAKIAAGTEEAVKAMAGNPRTATLSRQARRQIVEFVVGNAVFVLAHELGHGLINEMNMPVLGREEDAADSFAIVTMLKLGTAFSERVLFEAGKGLFLSAHRDKQEKSPLAFYGEHGLDLQRAYNVVCFMVGSNPEKYRQLAADTNLPKERQESCVYEWKNTAWSWGEVLQKHLRGDKPKTAVRVEYEDNKTFAVQARIMRDMGLLQSFATHAAEHYAWPNPITIEARSCGSANARWRQRVLTFCYELIGEFIELYVEHSSTLPPRYRAAPE
jgi:hypothetical protein